MTNAKTESLINLLAPTSHSNGNTRNPLTLESEPALDYEYAKTKSLIKLLAPTFHSNSETHNPLARESEPCNFTDSPYLDVPKIIALLKSIPSAFTIFSMNCQSINAKFNKLQIFLHQLRLENCSFDAICLQESWLSNNSDTSLLHLPGYHLINQPYIVSTHGGLMIYLKNCHQYKELPMTRSDHCESLSIEITRRNMKRIILSNVYRLPVHNKSDHEEFLTHFSKLANLHPNAHRIITGDFNMNLLEIHDPKKTYLNEFLDEAISSGFIPKITHPTRRDKKTGTWTLIDNFFINTKLQLNKTSAGILERPISDHLGYLLCLNEPTHPKRAHPPKYVYINSSSPEGLVNCKTNLTYINFNELLDPEHSDVNSNYSKFIDTLCEIKQQYIPYKRVKFNKYKHAKSEWITPEILKSTEFRDELYLKFVNAPFGTQQKMDLETNLNTYNNILKSMIRVAKQRHFNEVFLKYKNDIKQTWKSINLILNRNGSRRDFPDKFLLNNQPTSDNKTIANAFNHFFVNIGANLASSMGQPSSDDNFKQYLSLQPRPVTTFSFSPVTPEIVLKKIDSMKPKTSFGYDHISTKLLKYVKLELCQPITNLINQAFHENTFPDLLKIAKVSPIYKKGNPELVDNYRPISLLPSISKIFESIIHEQLFNYFTLNQLFYENQYGFRKGHSTEHATSELIDRLLQFLEDDDIPFSIFMDLSKAFDTLNHNILLSKLQFYGVYDDSLQLFRSYLQNRIQYVVINNTESDHLPISTGVPQGSILGPLLFLIYINDIACSSSLFSFLSYADDTTLTSSVKTLKSRNVSFKISSELSKVSDWLIANRLCLNVDKTKLMIFHQPLKKIPEFHISINNSEIEQVENFTFLGLTLDKQINWKPHIHNVCSKISKVLGVLSRLKRFLPQHVLKIIYNSLILPHINYSLICWGYGNTNRILNLQKRAVRSITCSKYNSHTDPLFKQLKFLTIDDCFMKVQLKFYYQLQHDLLPPYFRNMSIVTNKDNHHYNTRYKSEPVSVSGKEYTKKRIRVSISALIKYSCPGHRNNPKYFNDLFVTNSSLTTPKHLLNSILSKIDSLSLSSFCDFTKLAFISLYDDTPCLIRPCYSCGRL